MTPSKRHRLPGIAAASASLLLLTALLPATGMAAEREAGRMDVTLEGLSPDGRLPDAAAYCGPGGYGPNVSPGLSWSPGPAGTRSYAVLMVDPDVPMDLSNVNNPDVEIPEDAPRQTFVHWVLVDVAPTTTALPAGADGEGVTPRGKPFGPTANGVRGVNDYARFFNANPDTASPYGGYDGPCPPTNDARMHGYAVRVYALDVPTLGLSGPFDGRDVEKAMEGRVLAMGEAVGTYTLNPALR